MFDSRAKRLSTGHSQNAVSDTSTVMPDASAVSLPADNRAISASRACCDARPQSLRAIAGAARPFRGVRPPLRAGCPARYRPLSQKRLLRPPPRLRCHCRVRRPTSAIPRSASSPSSKPVLLHPQCDKRAFRPLLLDCWPASRIRVRIRCPRVLLRRPGPTPSTPLSMRKRESCLSLFPACLGSMCGCHRRQFSRFPNPRCSFSASAKWQLRQDISAAAPHSHIDATRRLQEAATWNNVLRTPVAAGTAAGTSPRCLWSRTVDASETPHQQCAQMHLSEDRRAGARGPGKAKRRVKITATCDDSGTGDLYNTPFQTLAEFSEILCAAILFLDPVLLDR